MTHHTAAILSIKGRFNSLCPPSSKEDVKSPEILFTIGLVLRA
jgi:hypothetical protein